MKKELPSISFKKYSIQEIIKNRPRIRLSPLPNFRAGPGGGKTEPPDNKKFK